MDNFLSADEANRLNAVVTGKRKREVGLVVPAEFTCITETTSSQYTLPRISQEKGEVQ